MQLLQDFGGDASRCEHSLLGCSLHHPLCFSLLVFGSGRHVSSSPSGLLIASSSALFCHSDCSASIKKLQEQNESHQVNRTRMVEAMSAALEKKDQVTASFPPPALPEASVGSQPDSRLFSGWRRNPNMADVLGNGSHQREGPTTVLLPGLQETL